MQKSYIYLTLCFILLIGIDQIKAQTVVFSSDSTDASKTVTEFNVNEKIYIHLTTEKPFNETVLIDDYYYLPRTKKCTACDFTMYMKIAGTKDYLTSILRLGNEDMSSNFDYSSNKIVIPLMPQDRIGKIQFINFYEGLKNGKTEIEVHIGMYDGRYDLRAKKRPKATIQLNKSTDDVLKYGVTFEDDFEASYSDPELEQKAVQSLNDRLKDSETSYIWKAAKIADKDWSVVRDRYNSTVLGREIRCYCYAVESDGKCMVYEYYFIQEFDGVTYFDSVHYYRTARSPSRGEVVDCTID